MSFLSLIALNRWLAKNVRDLMTRISVSEDVKLTGRAIRLTTTLKDGRKYTKEYIYSKGHPKNPLSDEELIDKFKKCARYSACQISDDLVDSIISTVLNLDKVDNVEKALLLPLFNPRNLP